MITTRLIQYALTALAAAGLFVTWLVTHDVRVKDKARTQVKQQIKDATYAQTNVIRDAAARSSNAGVRGKRDPSTRDE